MLEPDIKAKASAYTHPVSLALHANSPKRPDEGVGLPRVLGETLGILKEIDHLREGQGVRGGYFAVQPIEVVLVDGSRVLIPFLWVLDFGWSGRTGAVVWVK